MLRKAQTYANKKDNDDDTVDAEPVAANETNDIKDINKGVKR